MTSATAASALTRSGFRTAFDTCPDAYVLLQDAVIVYVNPAAVALFRAGSAGDLIGRTLLSQVHPRWRELAAARSAHLQSGQTNELARYQIVALDGAVIDVETSAAPVQLEGERFGAVVLRDMTYRVAVERRLDTAEAGFLALSNASGDSVWDWDLKTGTVWRTPSPLICEGNNATIGWWKDQVVPGDRARVIEGLDQAIASEARFWSDRYGFVRSDGANVTITDRAYIVRDETGNAIRMVGVMTDGSDFARVQEEKTALARLLEQTNRIASLGRLAATVAHEFNNVLMSIQPYAEVLQRKAGDAEVVRKSAAAIVQSVRRGTGITTEILRFARPVEPTLAPVALADWLERFAQDVAAMNMPKVEVRIEPPDPSVRVLADERQIEQLAINLVVNARDAMPDGGRITISAGSCAVCECPCDFLAHDQLPSCACLKFSDTGMGIPEEVMGKIFEPLFTTKRNGTGLGLAVGHQIATAHGGYLHARSEVGKGTTFFLVLRTP